MATEEQVSAFIEEAEAMGWRIELDDHRILPRCIDAANDAAAVDVGRFRKLASETLRRISDAAHELEKAGAVLREGADEVCGHRADGSQY